MRELLTELNKQTMDKFIEYLEDKIDGCKRTKAPYRDKIIYQLVLDEYKKQLTLTDVSQQHELLIAYEKNHYTPIEWSQVSKQCIEDINKFLAINCG